MFRLRASSHRLLSLQGEGREISFFVAHKRSPRRGGGMGERKKEKHQHYFVSLGTRVEGEGKNTSNYPEGRGNIFLTMKGIDGKGRKERDSVM